MRDFRRNKPRFDRMDADKPRARFGGRPEGRGSDRPRPRFGARPEGRDSDRPRPRFSGRDSGRKELEFTDVTCDKCGKACRVPFRPTNNKPVYCSDCFNKDGPSETRGRSSDSRQEPGSEALRQINMKLDKIIHALDLD